MVPQRRIFDRKWLFLCLISLLLSISISRALPVLQNRYPFSEHVTFNYYIELLRTILPTLPLALFIFSVLPFRRKLDYANIMKYLSARTFMLLAIAIAFIMTNLISLLYYNHIPQGDAVVTLYQAKIFAAGMLWTKIPPYPEFFLSEMVSSGAKWFSMAQKGHAFLLAPFQLLNIPWLLGPVLGSCTLALFFLFVRNSFNVEVAKESVLLLLLSPMFLLISASFLNQNTSLLLIMLSLFLLSLSIKNTSWYLPLLSGIFAGLAFLSRSTVSVFIPGCLLVLGFTGKDRARRVLLFLAGFLPAFSLQFMLNAVYTGNPFRFAYGLHPHPNLHAIGFGAGKGMPTYGIPGHGPLKALINLFYNGFAFSLHLFGWPLLSLSFIPFAFYGWTTQRWKLFSISVIAFSIIFFGLYWFHGISPMGPKYYFEICPILALLTALGIRKTGMRPLASILICLNILVFIPHALRPFRATWGTNNRCYSKTRALGIQNALVFIKDLPGRTEYEKTVNRHNYLSVGFRNDPVLETGAIIYAKSLGDENDRKLVRAYPERDAFIFEYTPSPPLFHIVPYAPQFSPLE